MHTCHMCGGVNALEGGGVTVKTLKFEKGGGA